MFQFQGSARSEFVGIFTYQSMPALLHHAEFAIFGSLVIQHFQASLEVSGEVCSSSYGVISSSFAIDSVRTGHGSIQTYF